MSRPRVNPLVLSEEQEQLFIQIWNNNRSIIAIPIISEKLGIAQDAVIHVAKRLRVEKKLRDKQHNRYPENEALAFKYDYENGRSLNEIAKAHNVGIDGVRKYLKEFYGGKIPKRMPTLENEIWKEIDGCSSHLVSNMGRIYVKSINRAIDGSLAHGYRHVSIKDNTGINHKFAVHRLVAQAFVPNPENKPQVDHIDSNPLNNKASNLQWVTQEEQLNNTESQKKKQIADEKRQKRWKIQPLIKKMLEIEHDKLELVKMIIEYDS